MSWTEPGESIRVRINTNNVEQRLAEKMYHQSSFAQRRRFQVCFDLPEDENIKWDIHLLTTRDPRMHCKKQKKS